MLRARHFFNDLTVEEELTGERYLKQRSHLFTNILQCSLAVKGLKAPQTCSTIYSVFFSVGVVSVEPVYVYAFYIVKK